MAADRLTNHREWLALLSAGRMRRNLGHPGMLAAAMLAHRRALGVPDSADGRHVDDLHKQCLAEYQAIAAETEKE